MAKKLMILIGGVIIALLFNGLTMESNQAFARPKKFKIKKFPKKTHKKIVSEESTTEDENGGPTSTGKTETTLAKSSATATTDSNQLQRGGRVEFDGRLVQGQTAQSGAIYLFARQRLPVESMIKERTNYRKEVLQTMNLQKDSSDEGRKSK